MVCMYYMFAPFKTPGKNTFSVHNAGQHKGYSFTNRFNNLSITDKKFLEKLTDPVHGKTNNLSLFQAKTQI